MYARIRVHFVALAHGLHNALPCPQLGGDASTDGGAGGVSIVLVTGP